MASTVGHALCGIDILLIGRLLRPQWFNKLTVGSVFLIVFLANAPDLDLLVGPLMGKHHHFLHGQMTHSIFFAVMCGLLFWGAAKLLAIESNRAKAMGVFVFAGLFSHVIVDWFTGPNPGFNPSFGIVILWPFSLERIHSPITLFLGPHHASLIELFSVHNLWVMTREVLIFGGTALGLWFFSASLRKQIKDFFQSLLPARFK